MTKKDKAVPEEIPLTEAPAIIQELAARQESFEERQAREQREAFIKRQEAAIAERREVLRSNGLADDTAGIDPAEAAKRCCS